MQCPVFYTNLRDKGYASIKRLTKKVDIFLMDLLVIPIHLENHWCWSIIDFRDKSVQYYDNMTCHKKESLVKLLYESYI